METIKQTDAETLQGLLNDVAPIVKVGHMSLGSASLHVLISLEPRESWANGILENSRYIRMSIQPLEIGFQIEHFSGGFTFRKGQSFRKSKAKNLTEVAEKIKKYVAKFPAYDSIKAEVEKLGGMNAWLTVERQAAGQFLPWERRPAPDDWVNAAEAMYS